jgi:hypothetical protein
MSQFNDPTFGAPPPPKKKSSATMWIIILLLLVLGVPVLCCGGIMGGFFMVGRNVLAAQMKSEFQNHAAVQEHIGADMDATLNFSASTAEQQQHPNEKVLVFDVKGSKGSGKIIATMPQQPGAQGINSAVLRTSDGKDITLK